MKFVDLQSWYVRFPRLLSSTLRLERLLHIAIVAFAVVIPSAIFVSTSVEAVEITPTTQLHARYSWMLPKTVLDVTIAYTLRSCKNTDHGAQVEVTIANPTVTPRYIPDPAVGLKSLDPALLKSFWQDSTISVVTNQSTHILQSLGSSPANQVVTIAGNVITGATKIAAASLGVVPASAPVAVEGPSKCGTEPTDTEILDKLKAELEKQQKILTNPNVTEADAAAATKKIATLQAGIAIVQAPQQAAQTTVTISRTVDPGITPIEMDENPTAKVPQRFRPIGPGGLIARFSPFQSMKKLKEAKWFDDAEKASSENNDHLHVSIYLDFSNANPRVVRCRTCSVYPTRVPKNFQFREVTYVPVAIYQGERDPNTPRDNRQSLVPLPAKALPFGQFGRAQILPINAKIFENLEWSVTFSEAGEVTNATFKSKSIGAQITSLFMSGAGGASSVTTEVRNASNTASSETQRLINENAALAAEVSNITLTQQLNAFIAKGLAPSR
jgi:hypothetical protein